MKTTSYLFLYAFLFMVACQGTKSSQTAAVQDDGMIDFTFLQINDVYEIAPIEGGTKGGLARVATIKKQLLAENRPVLTVLSGDFLNPSVIGTLKYQGKRIKGAHMIDVMNQLGVDVVTFGNHEFDLSYDELQERLNESNAVWLGTNVLYTDGQKIHSFYQKSVADASRDGSSANKYIQEMWIWDVVDDDGTKAKIGFFGATINSNPVPYVIYEDFRAEAIKAYQFLAEHTDLVIGVTHLEVGEDKELAQLLPEVPLLMGGHEHDHMEHQIGNVRIAKADANAKTAYVHRVRLNTRDGSSSIDSDLIPLDSSVPLDPEVSKAVEKWDNIADQLYSKEGFNIKEVISELNEPLDGKDASMRYQQTNLGEVITKCMSNAYSNENDCAILNSGSVRIDDEISGQVTQFDIIRAMPFGGGIAQVEMTGALLREVLDFAISKPGNGAYLQWDKIEKIDGKGWKINGQVLEDKKTYKVILNDFLLRGLDIPALKEGSEGLVAIVRPEKGDLKGDIRLLLIDYLKNK